MHLIVCIDDRDGMSFLGRRLSRDREVIAHILRLTKGSNLWVSPYTSKLFPEGSVLVTGEFQHAAEAGDYCFVENAVLPDVYGKLESVILYRWNRRYPSTVKFPREILESMRRESLEEFKGFSHETITMERYLP